jgi:hypothetical protein
VEIIHLVHAGARRNGTPAAPLPPALACIAAAAAALGIGLGAGLSGDALLVAPISLALLGVFLSARRWLDGRHRRTAADTCILRGLRSPARSTYAWRIEELTSARERRLLARSLRRLVSELSPNRLPGAIPLNRAAVRPHGARLLALAERLEALDRPVSPAGVLQVHRLLCEPDSSLYAPLADAAESPQRVGRELEVVENSLEPR